MTRSSALIIVCLAALACEDDPARAVKIAARPPAVAASAVKSPGAVTPPDAATLPDGSEPSRPEGPARSVDTAARPPAAGGAAARSAGSGWHPEACPPPAETSSGPGSLSVTGPCAFEHRAPVSCESTPDDFIVAMTRKAARDATLVVYLNVEKYHGPGKYDGAQMFVAVQDGTSLYRWSSDTLDATVGPGEAFVSLSRARLEAEPLLVDCSRTIGPSTNYQYQCEGRSSGKTDIESTFEVVSGRLSCKAGNEK